MSSPKLARTVKTGVRISKETGGAYANVQEVIESELARIREEVAKKTNSKGLECNADKQTQSNGNYGAAR